MPDEPKKPDDSDKDPEVVDGHPPATAANGEDGPPLQDDFARDFLGLPGVSGPDALFHDHLEGSDPVLPGARLLGEAIASSGSLEKNRDDLLFLKEFLDVKLDGKTLRDHIAVLQRFFKEDALPHDWAQIEMMRMYRNFTYPGKDGLLPLEFLRTSSGAEEADDFGPEFDIIEGVRSRLGAEAIPDGVFDNFNLKKHLIPREALFSSRPSHEHEEAEVAKAELWKEVKEKWARICSDPNSNYFFADILSFGQDPFSPDTALKCPRVLTALDLPGLGINPQTNDEYMAEIIRFRTLFLLIARKSFSQDIPDEDRNIPYYRVAYLFAQVAALLSEQLGNKLKGSPEDIRSNVPRVEDHPFAHKIKTPRREHTDGPACSVSEFSVHSPSLLMFPPGSSVDAVDVYIKCNLSLILPNRLSKSAESFASINSALCVQEDFLTMDLTILADRFGLLEKYKDVFNALNCYRRMQYFKHFHWDPESSKDPDRNRRPLKYLVDAMAKKRGRSISVASLGSSDMINEELMMSTGIVSKITAVDVDPEATFAETEVREGEDGKVKETIVGIFDKMRKSSGPDDLYQEDAEVRPRIMEALDVSDLVVAADVLHEVADPYRYVRDLWDKVAPGGSIYITEPVHCEAIDSVTTKSVNHYDKTKWAASMLPLEDYFNMIAFLNMTGAQIKAISVVPGTFAGYNDSYSRISIVLKKPAEPSGKKTTGYRGIDYELPYERSPEEWEQQLEKVEDIFQVWPLSTITDPAQRERLLETLNSNVKNCPLGDLRTSGFGLGKDGQISLKYRNVKREVIKWLLPISDVASYAAHHSLHLDPWTAQERVCDIRSVSARPYPIDKIQRVFGKMPEEFWKKNHLAAEVRFLDYLLRTAELNDGQQQTSLGAVDEEEEMPQKRLGVVANLGKGWGGL